MNNDGTLRKVNPKDGWLAARYASDIAASDGVPTKARHRNKLSTVLPQPHTPNTRVTLTMPSGILTARWLS